MHLKGYPRLRDVTLHVQAIILCLPRNVNMYNHYNSKLETTWELNSNFSLPHEAAPSQHRVLLYMVTHSRHNPLCVFTLVIH